MQYYNNYNNNNNNINNNNHEPFEPFEVRPSDSWSTLPNSIQRVVENSQNNRDFPIKYVVIHSALFILVNVGVIIVQIGMNLIQSVFSSVGIGYWVCYLHLLIIFLKS